MVPVVGLDAASGTGTRNRVRHPLRASRWCIVANCHRRKNPAHPYGVGGILVPVVGLEPTRGRPRRILNPLRLPFHHTGTLHDSI